MFYYTPTPKPHIDYSYSIAQLLRLIYKYYNTKDAVNKLYNTFEPVELFRAANFKEQVYKGWEASNKILGTPDKFIEQFYAIQEGIGKSLSICSKDKDCWLLKLSKATKETVKIKAFEYNSNWIYMYTYWLRRGYTVEEVSGEYYIVTEPFGKAYYIDSHKCTCKYGIEDKRCLHLQMIDWYKETKQLRVKHG